MYKPTQEDRELARKILIDETGKVNIHLNNDEIDDKVQVTLSISYSLTGKYDEDTLRKIIIRAIIENDVI